MGDLIQERDDAMYTDANQVAVTTKVQGDTNNRYQRRPSGLQEWGSGSATPDTNLYRGAANMLQTDDAFKQAGMIGSVENASTAATLSDYGLSVLNSTGGGTYTLPTPLYQGQEKRISALTSQTHTVNSASTACTIGATGALGFTMANVDNALTLIARSTSQWLVAGLGRYTSNWALTTGA